MDCPEVGSRSDCPVLSSSGGRRLVIGTPGEGALPTVTGGIETAGMADVIGITTVMITATTMTGYIGVEAIAAGGILTMNAENATSGSGDSRH